MTSRSQRETRIHYTPAKRTSPIKEKYGESPGGPQTPGAKAKVRKAKKAAKKTAKPY